MNLFDCFKESKRLVKQTEFVNVYSVKCDDKEYKIIIPKKRANDHTVIHFIDNTICWEQIPRFPRIVGRCYSERIPIYNFDGKISNTIFVVKGAPLADEGLDSGIFRSRRRYDENFVNCMTFKRFKEM